MPKFEFDYHNDFLGSWTIIRFKGKFITDPCQSELAKILPSIVHTQKCTIIVDTDRRGKLWLARDEDSCNIYAYNKKPIKDEDGIFRASDGEGYIGLSPDFPINLKPGECICASIRVKNIKKKGD